MSGAVWAAVWAAVWMGVWATVWVGDAGDGMNTGVHG